MRIRCSGVTYSIVVFALFWLQTEFSLNLFCTDPNYSSAARWMKKPTSAEEGKTEC